MTHASFVSVAAVVSNTKISTLVIIFPQNVCRFQKEIYSDP